MIRSHMLGLMAAIVFASPARAGEPAAFTADSIETIKAQYAGRPFILSLWSANWCGHCITELAMLGKLAQAQQPLPLVLVSTDTPEFSQSLQTTLKRLGLERMDSWVFDDDIPERLRHAIDPAWHGELPRTYLYDAHHQREVVVGVLNEKQLQAWLQKNH